MNEPIIPKKILWNIFKIGLRETKVLHEKIYLTEPLPIRFAWL